MLVGIVPTCTSSGVRPLTIVTSLYLFVCGRLTKIRLRGRGRVRPLPCIKQTVPQKILGLKFRDCTTSVEKGFWFPRRRTTLSLNSYLSFCQNQTFFLLQVSTQGSFCPHFFMSVVLDCEIDHDRRRNAAAFSPLSQGRNGGSGCQTQEVRRKRRDANEKKEWKIRT